MPRNITLYVPVKVTLHDEESSSIPAMHTSYATVPNEDHEIKELTVNMMNPAVFYLLGRTNDINHGFNGSISFLDSINTVLTYWSHIKSTEGDTIDVRDFPPPTGEEG